jgi:hypothetical protein
MIATRDNPHAFRRPEDNNLTVPHHVLLWLLTFAQEYPCMEQRRW